MLRAFVFSEKHPSLFLGLPESSRRIITREVLMAKFDLVFEGGGAKGSVFAGALEVFFSAGHQPARLVGTSAGAITAALLAAGYTPAEMLAAVNEQRGGKPRFATFMDVPDAA